MDREVFLGVVFWFFGVLIAALPLLFEATHGFQMTALALDRLYDNQYKEMIALVLVVVAVGIGDAADAGRRNNPGSLAAQFSMIVAFILIVGAIILAIFFGATLGKPEHVPKAPFSGLLWCLVLSGLARMLVEHGR